MKKIYLSTFVGLLALLLSLQAWACTNLLVTPGASADGSQFVFYANDGEYIPSIPRHAARRNTASDSSEWISWPNGLSGRIPEPAQTYATLGYQMNEYQLAVSETTFGGRHELHNRKVFLEYWHLMELALKRARTAREGVKVITDLVAEYGYGSEGESFYLADPKEAWVIEMVGKGEGEKGAIWVALRVPDGMVVAHANMARIGEFPLDDPENCLYAPDVIEFAKRKGYYDAKSGKPFRFNEAYDPATPAKLRYCESRVWSLFNRIAPSQGLKSDYARGVQKAEPYPLWIKPDRKLSLKDVMGLVRDHYEGTPFDMRKTLAAGPYGSPNQPRPMTWEVDGQQCSWERAISTPVTAYSFIAQLRAHMPNEVGGVLWFGLDDTYTNCYVPFYASVKQTPKAYSHGDLNKFSWESAWWTFNFVGNYVNLRYNDMVKDVQQVQSQTEDTFLQRQAAVERTAMALLSEDREACLDYLTEYTQQQADQTVARWKQLGEHLIMKYNDGYMKDEKFHLRTEPMQEEWRRKALQDDPGRKLPVWKQRKEKTKEPRNY